MQLPAELLLLIATVCADGEGTLARALCRTTIMDCVDQLKPTTPPTMERAVQACVEKRDLATITGMKR